MHSLHGPSRVILSMTLALAISCTAATSSLAQPTLGAWIDPGHGGKDGGAKGIDGDAPPNEKDFNLVISALVQNELEHAGFLCLLTRNSDILWSLGYRDSIAAGQAQNDNGDQETAVCCVSVHQNSNP